MRLTRQALASIVAYSALFSCQTFAESNSDLLVFVSADYLQRNSVTDPAVRSSDFTPTVDLLYSYNKNSWRLLAEYFITDDEAELERIQVGYTYRPDRTIWAGRFHQPSSAWNHRYHHGAYLQPSISRPSIENWEDDNGVLPSHVTGVMLDAWRQYGESAGMRIAIAAGLAPIIKAGELRPFDILDPGDGASRAVYSFNLSYHPDYVGETNFGLIAGYSELEARPDPTLGNTTDIEIRQKLLGVHGNLERQKWNGIVAAYYVDNKSHGSNVRVDCSFLAGYLQVLRDFTENTTAYLRFERTRNPNNAYLQLFPFYVHQRELAGFRWDFAERQAAHFEISSNRVVGDKYTEFRVQWSAAFP